MNERGRSERKESGVRGNEREFVVESDPHLIFGEKLLF